MPPGSRTEFHLRGWRIDHVLAAYEHALTQGGFRMISRLPQAPDRWRHKAVWGDSATAFAVQYAVPFGFGRDMDEGKRVCAEAEVSQWPDDAVLKILITPWMELFDRPEIFLLTQDPWEAMSDDRFCKQKMLETLRKMQSLGLPMRESQV